MRQLVDVSWSSIGKAITIILPIIAGSFWFGHYYCESKKNVELTDMMIKNNLDRINCERRIMQLENKVDSLQNVIKYGERTK